MPGRCDEGLPAASEGILGVFKLYVTFCVHIFNSEHIFKKNSPTGSRYLISFCVWTTPSGAQGVMPDSAWETTCGAWVNRGWQRAKQASPPYIMSPALLLFHFIKEKERKERIQVFTNSTIFIGPLMGKLENTVTFWFYFI